MEVLGRYYKCWGVAKEMELTKAQIISNDIIGDFGTGENDREGLIRSKEDRKTNEEELRSLQRP